MTTTFTFLTFRQSLLMCRVWTSWSISNTVHIWLTLIFVYVLISWTWYRHYKLLNITNAEKYEPFFNDVLIIERMKTLIYNIILLIKLIQTPRTLSHKFTRELSWLVKKTTGKHCGVFHLVLICIQLVFASWIETSLYLKEVKHKNDIFNPIKSLH